MSERFRVSPWPKPRLPKPQATFDYPFAHKKQPFVPDKLLQPISFNLAGDPTRPSPYQLRDWLNDPTTADCYSARALFEGLPGSLLNKILFNSGASIFQMVSLFHHCGVTYWKRVVWIDQYSLDQTKPRGGPLYYDYD